MISIISGTNRTPNNSEIIAQIYRRILEEKGHSPQVLPLTNLPPNIIATDLYGKRSKAFQPIQELVTATEKFIFIVPEYNGSFPGVLKVFIDACSFPESFMGKKAALVGHSTGRYGNIRGIEHFTGICHYCGLHVLPLKLHIPRVQHEFDQNGSLQQGDAHRFIHQQINQFLSF
ncbi:MAG TPA: NAD(P)H-dependent oxidoreductase [Anseongella sp.]